MAIYSWPVSLPQAPQRGFTETGGVLVLRTPMDSGPAKQRRRGQKPQVLQLSYLMTTAQVSTFEGFVKNDLKGTARYNYLHPRLNTTVEVRIVPQSGGELYNITYQAPGYWMVALTLEVLP